MSTGVNKCYVKCNSGNSGQSTASVSCLANTGGVLLASGGTSWTTLSNQRLKDITGTYGTALQDINKIKPIKFTWKQHPETGPQAGVIAQSVVDVVPEAISTITYATDQQEYQSALHGADPDYDRWAARGDEEDRDTRVASRTVIS